MATLFWRGDAPAVAQVSTVAITAYDVATTYKLTINGKTVSVVGSGGTTTTVATALAAAWNASTIPEFAEVTASSSTNTITLTADTAGVPFTATSSVSGGTGTIGSVTGSVANSGPNCWDTAANWSTGAIPVDADTVIFRNNAVDCLYGIDQTGIYLDKMAIYASYTGTIGLPRLNANDYIEYRPTALILDYVTRLEIGEGDGSGSGRIKLRTLSGATYGYVYSTGSRIESDVPSFVYNPPGAGSGIHVYSGDVGLDCDTAVTNSIGEIRIYGGTVQAGSLLNPLTVDGIDVFEGSCVHTSTTSTISEYRVLGGGSLVSNFANGGVTVTALTVQNGSYRWESGRATISAVTIRSEGSMEIAAPEFDPASLNVNLDRKITALTMYQGASFSDPDKATNLASSDITLTDCRLTDVTLDLGKNLVIRRQS